jgi:hypothetical protein
MPPPAPLLNMFLNVPALVLTLVVFAHWVALFAVAKPSIQAAFPSISISKRLLKAALKVVFVVVQRPCSTLFGTWKLSLY